MKDWSGKNRRKFAVKGPIQFLALHVTNIDASYYKSIYVCIHSLLRYGTRIKVYLYLLLYSVLCTADGSAIARRVRVKHSLLFFRSRTSLPYYSIPQCYHIQSVAFGTRPNTRCTPPPLLHKCIFTNWLWERYINNFLSFLPTGVRKVKLEKLFVTSLIRSYCCLYGEVYSMFTHEVYFDVSGLAGALVSHNSDSECSLGMN